MAEKAKIESNLFTKTETKHDPETKPQETQKDKIASRGLGLHKSEWAILDAIASDLGITRHAVTTYAARYFIAQYQAGKIKPETKTIKQLPRT